MDCYECGNDILSGAHWMSPSGKWFHPNCAYKHAAREKRYGGEQDADITKYKE